jgi:hypothetical protein
MKSRLFALWMLCLVPALSLTGRVQTEVPFVHSFDHSLGELALQGVQQDVPRAGELEVVDAQVGLAARREGALGVGQRRTQVSVVGVPGNAGLEILTVLVLMC